MALDAVVALPANVGLPIRLRFGAFDAYDNITELLAVTVTTQGTIAIVDSTVSAGTLRHGWVSLTGVEGAASVLAEIPGIPASGTSTALLAGPAKPLVIFDHIQGTLTSRQNGTAPSIDTIPAGSALGWVVAVGAYFLDLSLKFVSGPDAMLSTGWGPAYPSHFRQILTVPGTYRYTVEGLTGSDTATVVVQ